MRGFERVWRDVRHGWRALVKAPAFSAVAVVSIAFGTGANVAIFSAVDALLLRQPGIERPGGLVTVGTRIDRGLGTALRMSQPDFLDLRARARSLHGLVGFASRWVGFSPRPGMPARIKIATLVNADFFQALGVAPEIGRAFRPDEDAVPGRDPVVMLSDAVWQSDFGGSRDAVGRTIRLAGIDFTVIGVVPESFGGLDPFTRDDVYVPLAMWTTLMNAPDVDPLEDRGLRPLTVKGRIAPAATMASARAELDAIGTDLARAYPLTNRSQTFAIQSELEMRFERRPVDTHALTLLSILSIAVLLVACANVAGLLKSRGQARLREIAVRMSIGASRRDIVEQLLSESVAIAVAGSAGGLAIGYAGILLLRRIDFATEVFSYPVMQLDGRTFAFTLAVALASVFAFGVGPALQAARLDAAQAMKADATGRGSASHSLGRGALVASQVAVSLVVLTIATFVLQMFVREFTSGPGFRVTQMAMASVDAAQGGYRGAELVRFFERAADEAARLPGVLSATVTSEMPLWGLELSSMAPEGYALPAGQTGVRLYTSSIDERFFETLDIPIVSGRPFRATDNADTPRVAIVNETVARHYWPDGRAVGARFRIRTDAGPWVEIVGVAKDSTYVYPGEPPFEVAYLPFRQQPRGSMVLLAHTGGPSAALVTPLADTVRRLDLNVPVFNAQTIEHFYDARSTSVGRITVALIGSMGLMGLTLAMVGLYGLVSYAVGRRTREIGIRIAVGAAPFQVVALVVREGAWPAWAGAGIGLALSVVAARLLPAIVPIGPRYDATTVLACLPLLLGVTMVAAGIPAGRATRIDPTGALRAE